MTYHDGSINRHLPLPHDMWDDNDIQPTPPVDDYERQAILMEMDRHPSHGPLRLRADLERIGWHNVSLEAICGVKAGM